MIPRHAGAMPLAGGSLSFASDGMGLLAANGRSRSTLFGLTTSQSVVFTIGWQLTAFVLLSAQLILVSVCGSLTMVAGLMALVVLFHYRPLIAATIYFQILLYQNFFLSILSASGIDHASFSAAQGFAFGGIAGMAVVSGYRILRGASEGDVTRLLRMAGVSLVVIALYTGYGLAGSPATSALTYFRSASAMLFALIVGLDLGCTWNYRTVAHIFLISMAIGFLLAAVEYLAPNAYYGLINARDYAHLRAGDDDVPEISRGIQDLIAGRTFTWFNVTGGAGGMLSVRIFGPNMFAVSYSYVVAIFGVVAATTGNFGLTALALVFLGVEGVKGSILMLVLTLAIGLFWRLSPNMRVSLLASVTLLVCYAVVGIITGMRNGDFHVIGLLGGVYGFIRKPWGHGIGVGGNLSATVLQGGLNWEEWQKTGVDFALESAVGVLLYQMGIAAAAVYLPILALLRRAFRRITQRALFLGDRVALSRSDLLFASIAVTLVNGLFQEEAYSPYALGLLTLFGGVLGSNASRNPSALREA